ncbi:hypothetical protein [uncultured Pontibacter sp.]|uniref:hypothetical protein n=1 Tax=uncultured Pontibacter sp. TaxID=453356 RepID=UPI002608CFCE|nr:hypothetical protein [uncultured Pontibacter sp.]
MKKVFPIAFVLLMLVQSCISQQPAIQDYTKQTIVIPYQVKEVVIEDHRTDKLPMNWKLPVISAKQFEVTGNPDFTEDDEHQLKEFIKQTQNPEGAPSKITLRLIEGSCKIYADWKQATEYAQVAVELEVEELEGQNILKSNSEVFYEYNTLNALEKSVVKTYQTALKNATHQSLVQLTKQVK